MNDEELYTMITLDELLQIVESKNYAKLREVFEKYKEVDLAEIVEQFEKIEDVILIFRVVKSEHTAELFAYLSPSMQEKLIAAMSDKEVITLTEASSTDDIVDFLQDMPANVVAKVLKNAAPDTRSAINHLLNYKDNTAGSIMTTEFLAMLASTQVSDAIKVIRDKGREAETIYTIFCRDEKRNFQGTVDLDDLIFAKPEQKLSEIMNTNFVTANVNNDQEEVANQFKRYDLNSMAVLNDENKLIGIITIDDIVDVIDKEASEDISFQAGVSPLKDSYLETPIFKMAVKRLPWIIILLVLGMFSSIVLSFFQDEISVVPVLAAFIPVLMDTGGNAGSQTTALMVRSLALDEFKKGDDKRVIWKETRVAFIVATCVSIFSFCWFLFEMSVKLVNPGGANIYEVAGLVSITLWFTVMLSKSVGCILPLLAKKLNKDPALMSSPFLTTIVDICSLLIYFFIVTQVFHMIK